MPELRRTLSPREIPVLQNTFDMDIVITYVDGLDPLWRKDYEQYVGTEMLAKRFRDWGTLRYLFRGIEKNIPFAGKVFLLVARESQVPAWIDRTRVNVVLHSDIIPAGSLPLFNASSIEMFLHRIPGLDEEFVYFNDDTFPVLSCAPEDFFVGGKAVNRMSMHAVCFGNQFRRLCRRTSDFARKVAGLPRSPFYIRPQHTATSMLRSVSEEFFLSNEEELVNCLSRIRELKNYNQYVFLDYLHYTGRSVNKGKSNKHFSLASSSADDVCGFLAAPSRKLVCINDVQMSDERYSACRKAILDAFEKLLPEKSGFEL